MERKLGKQVVFKVDHLAVQDGWAFLRGVPKAPGSRPMDYRGTPYEAQMRDGAFEDAITALLRKRGDQWTVTTYDIGATDVVWLPWPSKYRAPEAIFP